MLKRLISNLRLYLKGQTIYRLSYDELRKVYFALDELNNVNKDAMKRVKNEMDKRIDDALAVCEQTWGAR